MYMYACLQLPTSCLVFCQNLKIVYKLPMERFNAESNTKNVETSENMAKKRKRNLPNRKWNDNEQAILLQFLKDNRPFEKPTAQIFYKKFLENSELDANWIVVKNKVRNMRMCYNKAKAWENTTGAGNLNDGETMRSALLKMCPYFNAMDEIFNSNNFSSEPIILESEDSCVNDSMLAPSLRNYTSTSEIIFEENMEHDTPDITPEIFVEEPSSTPASRKRIKGIFSRSAISDILEVHTEIMHMRREKFAADKIKMENEILLKQREMGIKEKEHALQQDRLNFEKEKEIKALKIKEIEIQSQEKLKILEIEMKTRIALEEIKSKERIELKKLENKT